MIPSTRLRPSSMPRFYVFAFYSSRRFGQDNNLLSCPIFGEWFLPGSWVHRC